MPAPPLLDFDALLAPLPGDDPSGAPVPHEVRRQLDEHRKEDDQDAYPPGHPMRPPTFKKADWPAIVQLAQETLTRTSKDLVVAARLTEALARMHGFAGLRHGLRLLRELVGGCWDRLRPPIEDGDVEVRTAAFHWLDDPDRGARFPNTLRALPLLSQQAGGYGWLHWQQGQQGGGPVPREKLDEAVQATAPEELAAVHEEIAGSLQELDLLAQALSDRAGPEAPGLLAIRRALEECSGLARAILRSKSPLPPAEPHIPDEQRADPAPSPPGAAPASRAEAYRQLAQAAAVLRALEPHSPIPYLVERAVALGDLPFPQLVRALIRDANVLAELDRELGLGEPPGPGAGGR